MTPILPPMEKAQQLINKMHLINSKKTAFKCALIAVDEILDYLALIEENETADFAFGGSYDGDTYFNYWNEVKAEINIRIKQL